MAVLLVGVRLPKEKKYLLIFTCTCLTATKKTTTKRKYCKEAIEKLVASTISCPELSYLLYKSHLLFLFFCTCNIICTQTLKNTDVSIFKGTIIGITKPTSSNIKFKFLVKNNDNQIFKFYYLFQFVLKN